MSTMKVQVIQCDGMNARDASKPVAIDNMTRCQERFVGDDSEPAVSVRRRARAAGWKRRDAAWDYCPEHIQ